MAEHLYTYDDPPAERHIAQAITALGEDGVICYPLDETWAFGADAARPKGIDKVRRLKPSHPKSRPFSLLCSSIAMASEYAAVTQAYYRILKKAWPGPYTIILPAIKTLARQLKDKRKVVGIRVTASPLLSAIIDELGRPLATTTVPLGEDDSPYQMGYEIVEDFGHGFDLCLDLGQELSGQESTVIDCTDSAPELIREGLGDVTPFGL